MKAFNETKTYPCRENAKGHILVNAKSTSYLSGYTLNELRKKGVKILVK